MPMPLPAEIRELEKAANVAVSADMFRAA